MAAAANTAIEGGVKADLMAQRISLTSAVFRIRRTNVPEADPRGFYRQIGEAESQGLELEVVGAVARGLGVRMLLATGDRFFVYPTKLREYQARYRGSFLHGGVTPEEMILFVSLLTPRTSR